jgi:hypothetical protein
MNMRLALAATLVFAAAGVRAEQPSVDFDKGVDAAAVVKHARQNVQKNPVSIKSRSSFRRYDRDCVGFTFGPNDGTQSEAVWLRSQEWVEECTYGPRGERQCWERPGFSYRERAQVVLRERQPLLPWEHDRFTVCLEGPWLDLYKGDSAYEYHLISGGRRDGSFLVAAGNKTAMKPDAAGLAVADWTSALKLTFNDRWAQYYAGEQTGLKLTLKRDISNWPDSTLVTKEITLPSAASYTVDLLAYLKDFSEKLQPGKKYYVKYEFRRLGKISKADWVGGSETSPTPYQPASLALGR